MADLPDVMRVALDAAFGLTREVAPEHYRIAMAALELVSEGDGKARGEEAAVAGVEILQRGAERGLEAGAARRGEGAGVNGVGDEGDVDFGHFTSYFENVTNFVITTSSDD